MSYDDHDTEKGCNDAECPKCGSLICLMYTSKERLNKSFFSPSLP